LRRFVRSCGKLAGFTPNRRKPNARCGFKPRHARQLRGVRSKIEKVGGGFSGGGLSGGGLGGGHVGGGFGGHGMGHMGGGGFAGGPANGEFHGGHFAHNDFHHGRRFAGGPFYDDYYYDYGTDCWRSERVHTPAGLRWRNVWTCTY